MQLFREYTAPVVKAYNRYMKDPYTTDTTQFVGGTSVGTDWVSRHYQTQTHYIRQKYLSLLRRVQRVDFWELLEDNWFRLIALNGLDRVATIRQGFPARKGHHYIPDTTSWALTEVTSGGLLQHGWLRGCLSNLLQFSFVTYPAIYFSSRVEAIPRFWAFSGFYLALDAFFYPWDKIKTLAYVDTNKQLPNWKSVVSQAYQRGGFDLYSGVACKTFFNIPWLWTIYTTVNDSPLWHKAASWATLALFYPILSRKTQIQVKTSIFGFDNLKEASRPGSYRGLGTFLLANLLGQIALYNLLPKHRLEEYEKEYQKGIHEYLQSPPEEE